ncbi:hypothetical protein Tco_0525933 [Tanacetum coccineum]
MFMIQFVVIGLVTSIVKSTLESLGGTLGNNNDGLNVSPTGIALPVSFATSASNGVDVVISKESIFVVNERLNNTVYGFFLGKRVAFPIVENYVKFHDIPITVFTKYGLSDIATKLGNPLMLDFYKAAMCTDSWSRVSYINAMVELQADVELKDTIMVDAPKFIGDGYTMSTIHNLKKPTQVIRGISVGSNPKSNFIYRPVQSTKKTDKAPGKPKVTKATNTTTSTSNSFDALNTFMDKDDCGCMNPSGTQEAEQV